MTTLELIVIIAATFYLGWRLGFWAASAAAAQIMEEAGVDEEQLERVASKMGLTDQVEAEEEKAIWFRIEKHGADLFAYRIETEEFIAQDSDPQGLIDRMAERFPKGTTFRIAEEDGADYIKHLMEEA
jgi:hypothetical protein